MCASYGFERRVLEKNIAYICRPLIDLLLGLHITTFIPAILSLQNSCGWLLVIWDLSLNDHLPIEFSCDHSICIELPYFNSLSTDLVFLSVFSFPLPFFFLLLSSIPLTTPFSLNSHLEWSPKRSGTPLLRTVLDTSGYWINECARPNDKCLSHCLHNNLFERDTNL